MGIRLSMASIPQVGNVQNTSIIYNAAFLYIFNFLRDWYKGTPLKINPFLSSLTFSYS